MQMDLPTASVLITVTITIGGFGIAVLRAKMPSGPSVWTKYVTFNDLSAKLKDFVRSKECEVNVSKMEAILRASERIMAAHRDSVEKQVDRALDGVHNEVHAMDERLTSNISSIHEKINTEMKQVRKEIRNNGH